MEETAYTTTLFRFYLFQIIRRSHTEFIFKTLTEIDRTVNSHLEFTKRYCKAIGIGYKK